MIRVGTCSWAEKTLIKSHEFYPKLASTAESRLRFYAEHFSTVEVDSTYYAIPNRSTAALWASRTPADFTFHIKAYAALTGHGIDPKTVPRDIYDLLAHKDKHEKQIYVKEPALMKVIAEKFVEALLPLAGSGKLGIVVFQFPPWFQYKTKHLDYILSCQNAMGRIPVAVEFRHGSWLTPDKQESVFHFMRKHRLIYVVADEPQYGNLSTIPFVPAVTGDIAYFRFHGRNKENWLKRGIETSLRYAYQYTEEELNSLVPAVKGADKRAKATYCMFNNHGSPGIRNAQMMAKLVQNR